MTGNPFSRPFRFFLTALLILSGCAGWGKRLEPPRVSLVHIALEEATFFETVFQIRLRVFNTNDVALTVRGIDCMLEINGKDFAQGVSAVEVEIPAHGTAAVPLTVYSSLADMVQGVFRLQQRETLRYRLEGRLQIEGGVMMPSSIAFDSSGEFSLDT